MCCSIGAAGFRPSSRAHDAGLSPCARNTIREAISRTRRAASQLAASMQDTLSEGTARAAQLAPSAVTASAVGGSATRSVVADSLRRRAARATIHVHGSTPRAHPVPGRGSAGPGRSPGRFFYNFKAILIQNLHITRGPTAPRPPPWPPSSDSNTSLQCSPFN